MNSWIQDAIKILHTEQFRSADTHLIRVPLPATPHIHFYLKDESTHITGSLKHRLARSLFLYALCNGYIKKDTTIIEASSGSTAISESYFAQLLGLKFIAVMTSCVSQGKIDMIQHYGGECEFVDSPSDIYPKALSLEKSYNGYFIDQFTNAERATDWRGNNNIAESIFEQMQHESCPVPKWMVMAAGTGGTSATLGRYIKYCGFETSLCVPDPENSVFYDSYITGKTDITISKGSRIEGIGRPRVEPSFIPTVIDRMMKITDTQSIATAHFLQRILGKRCGPSTGTNVYAAFKIAEEYRASQEPLSIISVLCDAGERYEHTIYNEKWLLEKQNINISSTLDEIQHFYEKGHFPIS